MRLLVVEERACSPKPRRRAADAGFAVDLSLDGTDALDSFAVTTYDVGCSTGTCQAYTLETCATGRPRQPRKPHPGCHAAADVDDRVRGWARSRYIPGKHSRSRSWWRRVPNASRGRHRCTGRGPPDLTVDLRGEPCSVMVGRCC